MPKQYVSENGIVKIPGAYPSYKVQNAPGGLAANGILMLIGEADGGAHWSDEEDLESDVSYGPDQLADVVAKFQSGTLVDAFRGAVTPSNDPGITGSFNRAILVKTNTGTKASSALLRLGDSAAYSTLYDKNFGAKGNLISRAVASSIAEVVPTTSSFTYIPAVGTVDIAFRVNGGASATLNVIANRSPTNFVADVNGVALIDATGGADRGILSVAGTLALAIVSGNQITLTRSVAWAVTPTAGDTLVIPASAPALLRDPAGGATDENVGAYVITGATSTIISATKLSDAGRGGAVAGVITAPAATAAPVTIAATTDAQAYSPVTIVQTAAAVVPGSGKSIEIAELTSGTDLLSRTAYSLATTSAVTWVSKSASPVLLTSAAESEVTMTMARSSDNISESFTEGGEIAMTVGYSGSSATLTISSTLLTTSTGLSLTLANFVTVKELADYIATQAGYTASVGSTVLGTLPPTALDRVSAIGISSQFGTVMPGRIKIDAFRMFTAIDTGSVLGQFGDPATRPSAGLPAVTSTGFLSGGARGGTTNTMISSALDALRSVDGNFVIPLFSRDATSDITDGVTDAASTYTIDSVLSLTKSHVLAMSTFKARKSRQGIASIQAAFNTQQAAGANLAHYRMNLAFQNPKDINSVGDIVTFQPWMASVKAGAMQAAGFYKSIENKKVNISGLTHSAGDFNPKTDSQMEDALTAGLMPLRASRTGGFVWVSDQTTYGTDDNFVFNSLQAVYAADTITLTTGQRMEQAFVGQSVADISANVALTYLDQIMADFLRLKLIAPSDDAKKGYKNAKIRISGNVMLVEVEIKLAGALDFVIINFVVSPVQQTAQ
jgi:hypothetical protein